MVEEAKRAGLLVDDEKVALVLGARGQGFAAPNPDACLHESLTGPWRLAEYVWKPHWNGETEWRANHFARRAWPKQPIVHDAAWLRRGGYSERLPTDAVRLGAMGAAAPTADPAALA
jgi:hypothetical protein